MNQIRVDHQLVLPDLQRDFVWSQDDIRLLLDSIMRGYPCGSLLMWQTRFRQVAYREFVLDHVAGATHAVKLKPRNESIKMVLDGQQRLQSLYLAFYGTYDGKRLYFNLTSGPRALDGETGKNYRFEFWRDDESNRPKRLVRVADVIAWNAQREDEAIDTCVETAGLEGAEAKVAAQNLRLLRRVVSQPSLVSVDTIDEDIVDEAQSRGLDEILDIFVRVNSGGTRLARSDLMFSLIKTRWASARHEFDELLGQVDMAGALAIDKDFVIRGLLTVADAPPTYDVDIVIRHWDEMHKRFDAFRSALTNAIDFCQAPDVGILSASLLHPTATLFPLIYYLSKQPNGSVPDAARGPLKTFLYFLLFNGFLGGRSPEARIRYLRAEMQQLNGSELPLPALLRVIATRQKSHSVETSAEMLNWNPRLTLNLAQPQVRRETLSWQERAEVDHVFPQSAYRPRFGDLVDDIGNFAYLGKLRNIRKTNELPSSYFKSVTDDVLARDYLIDDRALLADERFEQFVARRRDRLVQVVRAALGR